MANNKEGSSLAFKLFALYVALISVMLAALLQLPEIILPMLGETELSFKYDAWWQANKYTHTHTHTYTQTHTHTLKHTNLYTYT